MIGVELPCERESALAFGCNRERVEVRRLHLAFTRSTQQLEFDLGSYTNKALIDLDGETLFGELAIVRLLERAGWDAVWLDTYHGDKRWAGMPHLVRPVTLDARHEELLGRVRARHGRRGGAWDVFGWRGGEVAFLESKGPGDSIRPNQRTWLSAALAEGLEPSAFTVVEWSLSGSAPDRGPRRSRGRPVPEPATIPGSERWMPIHIDFEEHLPGSYIAKLKKMNLSPGIDNTLRRVRARVETRPTRLRAAQERELVSADGTTLTREGEDLLAYLSRWVAEEDYPPELLLPSG